MTHQNCPPYFNGYNLVLRFYKFMASKKYEYRKNADLLKMLLKGFQTLNYNSEWLESPEKGIALIMTHHSSSKFYSDRF